MPHIRPNFQSPGTVIKTTRSKLEASTSSCQCQLNPQWLLHNPSSNERTQIDFLTRCQLHELQLSLPSYLAYLQWHVFFDTQRDGFSLAQLYRASDCVKQCKQRDGTTSSLSEVNTTNFRFHGGMNDAEDGYDIPSLCLMVVAPRHEDRSVEGRQSVIGFFTSVLPNTSHHDARHFFGGKDTYVFRFHHTTDTSQTKGEVPPYHGPGSGGVHAFHWVGIQEGGPSKNNNEFLICSRNFIGVGGGSHGGAAIYFDEELQFGTCASYCDTFGCCCLCGSPSRGLHHSEFVILRMVWVALGTSSSDSSTTSESPCECRRSSKAHRCPLRK